MEEEVKKILESVVANRLVNEDYKEEMDSLYLKVNLRRLNELDLMIGELGELRKPVSFSKFQFS